MSRSFRRSGEIAATGVALVLLVCLPAGATTTEPENPAEGSGVVSQDGGSDVVTVTASTSSLPVGSEGASDDGCAAESGTDVVVDDDFVTPVTAGYVLVEPVSTAVAGVQAPVVRTFTSSAAVGQTSETRLFSPTGRWFRYNCGSDFFLLPEGGPAVNIGGLIDEAIAQLDPPEPPLSVTPDHGKHAVQMASWLAIDPDYWNEERSRTVRSGRVVVQATLTPTQIEWDMGNQDVMTCDNPGLIWRKGMADDLNPCGYTYTWPSINPPDNTYELAGTISFDVAHRTNAPGSYGPWVPVERTASQTIQVVEIQAIGTRTS